MAEEHDFVDLEGEDKDSSGSDNSDDDHVDDADVEVEGKDGDDAKKDGEGKDGEDGDGKDKKKAKKKLTKAQLARQKAIARLKKAAAELEDDDGTPSVMERIRDYRIAPGSHEYIAWEVNIVFCVLWQAIAVPFTVGMELKKKDQWDFATWYNVVADVAFIVDLPIQFTMSYEDKYGTMHTSRKEIALQYLGDTDWKRLIMQVALFPLYQIYTGRGLLLLDIVAAIPWDWFLVSDCVVDGDYTKCDAMGDDCEARECRLRRCLLKTATLKFIRLLRIGRLMKFLNKYQSQTLAKIFRLFAGFMLFAHWTGCMMWYVGVNFEPFVDGVRDGSWVRGQGLLTFSPDNRFCHRGGCGCTYDGTCDESELADPCIVKSDEPDVPLTYRYARSLYWALTTITSVGYGDMCPSTNKEIEFMILVEIGGAAFYAIIFSNMAVYVASLSAVHERYLEKIQSISEQMRHLDLSLHMQKKVEMYFEYLYLRHKALLDDDDYFFRELPTPLERQITSFLHSATVSGVHLFSGCTPEFIAELARRLKPLIVTPHQFIVHKGERATCIYFIRRGTVDVIEDSFAESEKLGELRTGDYFGEMAVLNDARRTCSVRAQGFCDLYIVSSADLHDMLDSFPQDQGQVLRNALSFFERKEVEPEKGQKDEVRDAIADRSSARRISARRSSARERRSQRASNRAAKEAAGEKVDDGDETDSDGSAASEEVFTDDEGENDFMVVK